MGCGTRLTYPTIGGWWVEVRAFIRAFDRKPEAGIMLSLQELLPTIFFRVYFRLLFDIEFICAGFILSRRNIQR